MNPILKPLAAAFLTMTATAALAEDVALVISTPSDFRGRSASRVADGHASLIEALQQAGYTIHQVSDGDRDDLIDRIADFEADLDEAERVLIYYVGDYLVAGDKTYLLPTDARTRSLTEALGGSVPMDLLLTLAGTRPADSLVALGLGSQVPVPGGRRTGGPVLDIPQGVMVARGGPRAVLALVDDEMLRKGLSAGQIDPGKARVTFDGLVLPDFALTDPEAEPAALPEPPQVTPVEPEDFAEETLWALARNGDNRVAYQLYLQRYPEGKYAGQARAALGLPAPGSEPTPREVEDALALNRTARRQVQSDLTVLGFDTRGIDGIFGGGTRTALRGWQAENDFEVSGFLDAEQLARLDAQADIRREEIRIEEERQAREQARQDRAFWRQTGSSGEEEDLRTYLNRFPEGIHSAEAKAALASIEADRNRAEDDDAFATARQADTERAYRRYLRQFPEGLHAREARDRLDEILRGSADLAEVEKHRDQERALGLNVASALVVEQRLRQLGYDVGPVDGRLDRQSRDSIARFQSENGMTATGYLNTATIQRLILASSR